MATTEITLSGTIHGHLWMPCAWASKRFERKIGPGPFQQEWLGLRDTLLAIDTQEGGDFRFTRYANLLLTIQRSSWNSENHTRFTRTKYLRLDDHADLEDMTLSPEEEDEILSEWGSEDEE